jgi:peptidyl-prolyl cis-trans isomerase D
MLDALRRGAGTWVAKVFIGLLVLSFAAWGIADIFSGRQGTALATVGDEEITEAEYREVFQRELQQLSQRLGQQISVEQARQLGVDRQVLQRLVSQAALDGTAKSFGLAVSDEAIAQRIGSDPLFRNARGQFDRARFEQLLANNGFTEAAYVSVERRNILRSQLAGIVDRAVTVPVEMVKAVHRQQNETRIAEYFVLPPDRAGEIAAPSPEEMKEYYEANKRRFTAPEFRTLTVLRLEPKDVAATIAISDEDIKRAYEDRHDEFGTPERRDVEQITFASETEAAEASARLSEGADFVAIATERGMKPVDYKLGVVTRDEIADPEVAEAVFALDEGQVSKPIKGTLSVVIARVLKTVPEERKSYDEIKTTLRDQLALEKAQEEISNLHDAVEDARAGGSTLAEIANKLNLPLIRVDAIDRNGNGPDNKPIETIPAAPRVLNVAFQSDVGVENDPVDTPDDGYAWVDVEEVTPEANRPFDEVKAEVSELWIAERKREKLFETATALVE